MDYITIIQNCIDYIEDHLLEQIDYKILAKQVPMSCYNFHRTFSMLVGMTVTEYVRRRRLSKAGEEVLNTSHKIIEIALTYGYDTPEGFSKAFTRFHGMTPLAARKGGHEIKLFNPIVMKLSIEGGREIDYRLESLDQISYIAYVKQFHVGKVNEANNQEIPAFWGECLDSGIMDAFM